MAKEKFRRIVSLEPLEKEVDLIKGITKVLRNKDAKTFNCPECGYKVMRLGCGANYTWRIEFCVNPLCHWTRKLVRLFGEKNWREYEG